MSPEDFARRKRKTVLAWVGAGLVLLIVGVWIYQRSASAQDVRKAFSDGEQMLKANRYREAIQSFDRALAGDRKLAGAYLERGRANAALSQTHAAIQDFTKVIQLQPDSAEAYVERAAVYLGLSDYLAVVADCGDAIARNPKLAHAHTLRGMALREMGNLPKYLEDFNRAVELSPGLDNYFQRATAFQGLGDHTKAIADLDQVISLYPTSPMGYLARAKSREAIGDAAGARNDRETGRILEGREN